MLPSTELQVWWATGNDVVAYSAPGPAVVSTLDLGDQKRGIVISGRIERFLILADRPK
jgi:hypothetical protein